MEAGVASGGTSLGFWPRKPRLTQGRREELWAWVLVSPWVIGFIVFTLGPMLASLGLSLFETDMLQARFVGLQNYATLFSFDETRSLFWKALYNTVYYVLFSIPLTISIGFAIAVLMNQNIRGQSFYRVVYYLPAVLPGVAVSLLWLWLFDAQFGIINWVLSLFGIKGMAWLYDTRTAKPALIIMSLWGAGANMLIFLAGLQGIPTQLYEAAMIDGAGLWRRFTRITVPMISPTLFFVLVTESIYSFQVFTSSYIMTRGGPANATLMYVLYLYNLAFRQFNMGFASALAWVFFIIIMLVTVVMFRSSDAWVYYESEIGGPAR